MADEELAINIIGTEKNKKTRWCLLKLPLDEASAKTFVLEKAVCSHGLFMMPPNQWDPLTRSLSRPLHLPSPWSSSSSVMVNISQPRDDSGFLHVKVYCGDNGGEWSLSEEQKETLVGQIKRMLRLSEIDERNATEFKKMIESADDHRGSFSGRVFRSPTLFEDMVKCILLCNCQWSRTLSMARALCELQFELNHCSFGACGSQAETGDSIPKTPAGKESRRKLKVSKAPEVSSGADDCPKISSVMMTEENLNLHFTQSNIEDDSATLNELSTADLSPVLDKIGNFPSPEELANLDERFLAKRCNLGYRAGRILKLAKGIVEGGIKIKQLEEVCKDKSLSSYNKLAEQLSVINGFSPFTRANVLVCMGFYHVIPSDSETIRHLKKVHGKNSSIKMVQWDVEAIYGKYAPYQFLAYWSELWHFYEKRFGNLSEMPYSDYKLITANNMKSKAKCNVKRKKPS